METGNHDGTRPKGEPGAGVDEGPGAGARARASEEQVRDWLVAYLARLLDMDPSRVDPALPLERYGLDSAAAVALTGDLARWLGTELEPDLTRGRPTIDGVARYVAEELARRHASPA